MGLKWVWTIPNVLSLLRIALVPLFAVLYLMSEANPTLLWWSIAALFLSALTDMFDGLIARKCNQISEIGKLLDPIADKLTQVTVVVCLAIRLPRLMPLVVLCVLKELMQTIGAVMLLTRHHSEVQAAKWYGKVSTVVFYIAMAMFAICPPAPTPALIFGWNMPVWMFVLIVSIVAICMLFAFYQYARLFVTLARESDQKNTDD